MHTSAGAGLFRGRPLRAVGLAVAAALAARVALVLAAWVIAGPTTFVAPDTATYLAPAASLVERFAFENALGRPELFRTPGYPLLLVPGVLAGHPLSVALLLHLALTVALVLLTYELARRTGAGERLAGTCALVVALEPATLLWSIKVLPETLFTTLIVAGAAATARALETHEARWAALAALSLVAAAYVKPIAYPLVFVAFVILSGGQVWARRRPRAAVVFAVACAVLLVPWHARNMRAAGFPGFSTLAAHAIYLSAGGSVKARHEGAAYADVRQQLLAAARAQPQETRNRHMWREGWALLRADLRGYAVTHVQGMARTLLDPGAVEYLRLLGSYPDEGGALTRTVDRGLVRGARDWARERPAAFWSSALLAPVPLVLVTLAVLGTTRPGAWRRPAFAVSALLASYLVVAGGGVPGSSRFRVPATPLLVVMAGAAIGRDRTLRPAAPAHTLPG